MGNPSAAERLCEDDDDSDAVSVNMLFTRCLNVVQLVMRLIARMDTVFRIQIFV